MTRSVLIEKVTEKVEGLTKKQVEAIINTIFEGMKEALARGEKIEIRGFGNFRLKAREGKVARNPKTGEKVQVPVETGHSLQGRKAVPRRTEQRRKLIIPAGGPGTHPAAVSYGAQSISQKGRFFVLLPVGISLGVAAAFLYPRALLSEKNRTSILWTKTSSRVAVSAWSPSACIQRSMM